MSRVRLVACLLAVLIAAVVGLRWYSATVAAETPATVALSQPAASRLITRQVSASAVHQLTVADLRSITDRVINPIERGTDLRQIYERYRDSRFGFERAFARRAWTTCFPEFMSGVGEALSVERLMTGTASTEPNYAARVSAYRELLRRCAPFLEMSRDDVLTLTTFQDNQWKKGEALDPGELAVFHLRAGESEKALAVVADVLRSGDAYALSTLREFVHQHIMLEVDAQRLPGNTRVDIRTLAIAQAACELGLDCSKDSLTAVKLCAHGGLCEGDAMTRQMQPLTEPADRAQVVQIAQRIAAVARRGDAAAAACLWSDC